VYELQVNSLDPNPAASIMQSASNEKRWQIRRAVDLPLLRTLQHNLGIHPLTAHLLILRGQDTPELADRFLNPSLQHLPDPHQMSGMKQACQRIIEAIEREERIVIYGDYDVDGVTSTSILWMFLLELGIPPQRLHFFIPHRINDGYGLQCSCIPNIAALGCDLLLTVDCGIGSVCEIKECNTQGMDVIVIDHHQPSPNKPEAVAILNPRQAHCQYPDKDLAAVGVTYQLMIGLRTTLRERGYFAVHPEPNLLKYLDLVALGTVADIVPLRGVNRILVHRGLQQMRSSCWPGLQALLNVSGTKAQDLNADHIAFRLGPRINAAGRLEHATIGVELLCSKDRHQADKLALALDHANVTRKQLQEDIYQQAQQILLQQPQLLEDSALVLASKEWHLGVIGIVASKLLERFYRPVVMLALNPQSGLGKGSARSIEGFDIYRALDACSDHLLRFGGHRAAAGLTLEIAQIEQFRRALAKIAETAIRPEDLQPKVFFDARFDPERLTQALISELNQLEPFGAHNPSPCLMANNIQITKQNKTRDGRHLQLTLLPSQRSFKAIAFAQADKYPLPPSVSIIYRPQFNDWQGQQSIQLNIQELKGCI
jgi:single-stranded-DNA-specific exonuclease